MTQRGFVSRSPSVAELSERLPLVRYSSHSPAGRLIEVYLRRHGISPANTLEFDSSDCIMATVSAGRG